MPRTAAQRIPQSERVTFTGWAKVMAEGFWWCKRCKRKVEPVEQTDFQDESRIFQVCPHCDSTHHLKYFAPIFKS
jgi:hypothetical protein